MRRLLGLKDSTSTPSSNAKGKQRQRDSTSTSVSSSSQTPMEVHVITEVHSAPDRRGFQPITSTTALTSSSPTSIDSQPLPPEIHGPTHPYPYWQGSTHTPSSSSQSSLESPMTPSHVSWLNLANAQGNADATSKGSNTHSSLTNSASVPQHSVEPSSSAQGRSSPSPHFPPPPPTSPPPNVVARPKLLHPTKSSHSLRVPVQEFFNQQLSPIVEQDYFSPEKRPISLPSSSHEGGGSGSSTAYTARTSAAVMTPVSPVSDGVGTATVTPISPVPITPVLIGARGAPPMLQMQEQTPVTPLYPGSVVPFARRKEENGSESPRKNSSMPSPVSTFILRPLNRSVSLSSTRTHQSSVSSVTPPVIPPLDLRPEFRGQAFLTTPTSLNSRGLLDIGARDDDSVSDRRASFVTARTGPGRESKYSLGQEEIFVDAEEFSRRDSNGNVYQFDPRLPEDIADTPPTPRPPQIPHNDSKPVKPPIPARTILHPLSASRTSSSLPSYNHPPGPQGSNHHLQPGPQPQFQPHRSTPSPMMHPSRLGVSAPSLQELGTSISTSSSFIDRRFAPSSLYLPPTSERQSARKARSKWTLHMDTVQVLFWLGFIAPWCWLIGGWLISPKSPSHGYGSGPMYGNRYHTRSSLLPLMTNSKSMQSFDTMKGYHGYPFVAPSAMTLTSPPPPYQSQRSIGVLIAKPFGSGMKNVWVRRCRIAAVASGVLLMVAFIVAIVVAATSHGI